MDSRPETNSQTKADYVNLTTPFAKGTPMQSAKREVHGQLTDKRFWLGLAAVVVILVVAGPFGTGDDKDWLGLLGYWSIIAFGTYLACLSASAFGTKQLMQWGVSNPTAQIIAAVPGGLAAFAVVFAITPIAGFTNPPNTVTLMVQCVLISVAVNVLFIAFRTKTDARTSSNKTNLVLEKLKPEKRGSIIRIETQDHYLNITTTKGSDLILMRMSDAVTALDDLGTQTHRSHWVAKTAITGSDRQNNRWVLSLSDGSTVPVSRPYVQSLRDQGLLPRAR